MVEDVTIGKVVNTHGVRGGLKILPEDPETVNLRIGKTVYIGNRPYTIQSVRKNKNVFLVTFEGYEDINKVEDLKGQWITLPEDQLEPLPEGRYYIFQLLGLDCYQADEKIGVVTEVDTNSVNDVYTIKGVKTWRVPNVPVFIQGIDLEKGRMDVSLIEGMADED